MRKNVILRYALCGLVLTGLSACSDFFEPQNSTMLQGDKYIKEASEMYAGFLGVVTKIQAIGDKNIYLNDSRAELMIPTDRDVDMYSLSNYESNLKGNTYADPAKYYDVIISCNDYLQKIYEYKQAHVYSIDMEHYKGLVGSAIRTKVWVYFTMAKIYNEVVWFDDPMHEMKDYSNYPKLNLDQTIEKCASYLETGFDGVAGKYTMPWTEWIASDNSLSAGTYYYWDLMVPDYFVLAADLALWRGKYQDVVNLVLPQMNEAFASSSTFTKWMCAANYGNAYTKGQIFTAAQPNSMAAVSVIIYNYKKSQTNTTKDNLYSAPILRPSEAAVARFSDKEFNPNAYTALDARDPRFSTHISLDSYGNWRMQKWRYNSDNFIYLYRNVELYFMLIEAFNHLGRYDEMNALMNEGVSFYFPDGGVTYPGFTNDWTKRGGAVTHAYADTGIRGTWYSTKGLQYRQMKPCDSEENKRHNDMELLREICLEMPCEGKTLPAMIRMAKRYNDPTIISELVCGKYSEEETATAAKIRAKIESNDYFVHWNIQDTSSEHK